MQVQINCQKLQGPALKHLMLRQEIEGWDMHQCSIAQLRERIRSLFVESEAAYAQKALDMTFSGKNLVHDCSFLGCNFPTVRLLTVLMGMPSCTAPCAR